MTAPTVVGKLSDGEDSQACQRATTRKIGAQLCPCPFELYCGLFTSGHLFSCEGECHLPSGAWLAEVLSLLQHIKVYSWVP